MERYLIVGNGESPHILKWARELHKYYDVFLFSSQGISEDIKGLLPEDHLFAFHMNISESGGNLKMLRLVLPLMRLMNKIRPDIVNAHYITSHGLIAALAAVLRRKPVLLVQSAWGSDILIAPFKNRLYRKTTSFALKKARLATADSGRVAEIMQELAGTETMTFPFGLEKLPEADPGEKIPFLFFSNRTLNKNSNIDQVLHFFGRVCGQHEQARLVIANDGPERAGLEEQCRQMGLDKKVEFAGFIPDHQQQHYYRQAQFFFSILSSDALSVSLLEALSFGCIPIVSKLSDNMEWVSDGVNGILMTEDTGFSQLEGMQHKAREIFTHNRKTITERAIFPDSIRLFRQKLDKITEA